MLTNISLLSNISPHMSFSIRMKVWNFCMTRETKLAMGQNNIFPEQNLHQWTSDHTKISYFPAPMHCIRDTSAALYFPWLGFCHAAPFYPNNANEP